MIVQPNFLDHWKTNALSAKIGRLEAITALLALWSHCQQQRTWQFPDSEIMIAGICRYSGNPRVLLETLVELKLLEKVGENTLEVHEWAETNAKLLHNWEVGKRGGRPPKQPKDKPTGNPRDNPERTHGKPKGEPIREDKIREEKTPIVPKGTDNDAAPEGWEEAMDALEGPCWRESAEQWADLNDHQRARAAEVVAGKRELKEMMALFANESTSDSEPPAETSDAAPPRKKKKGGGAAAEIYEAYPRKVGRDAALRAIQRRLDQGLEPVVLMTATRLYAEATAKWPASERQYIPHPATWFNRGSFDDDPREWARSGPADPGAQKKEGGAPPPLESAPSKQSKPPPEGYDRAMAAMFGADWKSWAPSWYGLTPTDRAKIEAWLRANPEDTEND